MAEDIFEKLYAVLRARRDADPESSYAAGLYAQGTGKIAGKVMEEARETVEEALRGDRERLAAESADLLFHLMVLWADQDMEPQEAFKILEKRFGTSGLVDKAQRKT